MEVLTVNDDPNEATTANREFETFYLRHRDRVYRYLRARTRSREDADDLTQQVFAKALDSLHNGNQRREVSTPWLFVIARNLVVDYYRRRKPLYVCIESAWQNAATQSVHELAERAEELAHVRKVVSQLSREKQDLIALRFGAGLTYEEIGRVIGRSAEATRKRLSRTVKELEVMFNEQE